MKKLKSEKGITLIMVLIVIVVIAILTSAAVSHIDIGKDIKDYNYMCADIEILKNKITMYYNNNNCLPVKGSAFNAKSMLEDQASTKDNDNYYVIDMGKISNVTLNYGGGDINNKNIYIINEKTHNVYYLNGIKYDGTVYYKKFK